VGITTRRGSYLSGESGIVGTNLFYEALELSGYERKAIDKLILGWIS
jgi:hypothetical protein